MTRRLPLLLLFILSFLSLRPEARACTSLRVKTEDGAVIYARTMEGAWTLQTVLGVTPKGSSFVGTLPDGTSNGAKWTAKYGFVGMFDFGLPLVSDGMNEKGLVIGHLFFPGYADYEPYEPDKAGKTIAQFEVGNWVLSNFATVEEVRKGFSDVRVCKGPIGPAGPLPLHYVVHDASGDCVVIEHTAGKVTIHDNPLGVMTNSPPFDWMTTYLSNFINLSATNVPQRDLKGFTLHEYGQGSGMLGLPGDYTPPSRFVRMVALTQAALPVKGAENGLNLAMTIIDNVDIPIGAAREKTPTGEGFDKTCWTVAADTSRLRYHFRAYDNKNWRYADVPKALAQAKGIMAIPVLTPADYTDVTAAMKPMP